MSSFTEFTLPSTDGIHKLHVCAWLPEGEPKAIVQISHGIAEYAARYDRYARVLASHGYYVVANDHLGHGLTAQSREELGYPGEEGGWLHMADDLHVVSQHVRGDYPALPYILLGHSMGSFLARTYLIRYPGQVDGCILSGTGQEPAGAVRSGEALAAALKKAQKGSSKVAMIQKLMFGNYVKKIDHPRTPQDWLSRDPGEVDAYRADPMCGAPVSTALACELLFGLRYIWNPENLARMDRNTPIYFYSGDADPVGSYGKGVQKVAERFKALGCRDVTVKLYPGGRHEMHNETNREEVYRDTLRWLERVSRR